MTFFRNGLVAAAISLAFALPALAGGHLPAHIETAVNSADRTDRDRSRDANRRPGEVLAFIGVEPGDKVADLGAGSGYYTVLFKSAVAETGKVYAFNPTWIAERFERAHQAMIGLAEAPNVAYSTGEMEALSFPEPLDAVVIVLFYHDTVWKDDDRIKMNGQIFDALKPGGAYVIVDHHAREGSGAADVDAFHRIDAALVRSEVEAAGFVMDSESDVLKNPQDGRDESVFGALRGKTDRFVYKFVKPAS